MNYKEFKELVNSQRVRNSNETEVVVRVTRGYPAVGGSHFVLVKGISQGTDWDSGKVFIRLDEPVAVIDEETETAKSFWRNLIESYWSGLSNNTLSDFYFLLGKKFEEALEKSGWKAKIEERVAQTKLLEQKAKEARSKKSKHYK